jgi:hypothetical protein
MSGSNDSVGPVAMLVDNICHINNGGVQEVAAFLARQPLHVRARFIERCSSLIGAAAEQDAASPTQAVVPLKSTGAST